MRVRDKEDGGPPAFTTSRIHFHAFQAATLTFFALVAGAPAVFGCSDDEGPAGRAALACPEKWAKENVLNPMSTPPFSPRVHQGHCASCATCAPCSLHSNPTWMRGVVPARFSLSLVLPPRRGPPPPPIVSSHMFRLTLIIRVSCIHTHHTQPPTAPVCQPGVIGQSLGVFVETTRLVAVGHHDKCQLVE